MSSTFKGTVRHSGNSLVVTIPKPIAGGLEIEDGSEVRITVQKVDEKEETQ